MYMLWLLLTAEVWMGVKTSAVRWRWDKTFDGSFD